jgi:hypothetical protein
VGPLHRPQTCPDLRYFKAGDGLSRNVRQPDRTRMGPVQGHAQTSYAVDSQAQSAEFGSRHPLLMKAPVTDRGLFRAYRGTSAGVGPTTSGQSAAGAPLRSQP